MNDRSRTYTSPTGDFDFSTPEGQRALDASLDLVMEIRREVNRKVDLYERTLGLAVIPVLLRRAVLVALRRMRHTRATG